MLPSLEVLEMHFSGSLMTVDVVFVVNDIYCNEDGMVVMLNVQSICGNTFKMMSATMYQGCWRSSLF